LFIFAPWEFPVHLEPINKLLTTESDRFFWSAPNQKRCCCLYTVVVFLFWRW
jgi:hypothetical protein